MNEEKSWKSWVTIGLLLSISLILADQYFLLIEKPTVDVRSQLHQSIIDGTADSPYRYRVLVPYLTQGLSLILHPLFETDSLVYSYRIFDTLAIFASLLTLYQYLRNWFSDRISLIGVLIMSTSMLVGFQNHYYQPWSLLEPAVFALGLNLLLNKRYGWFGVIIALGTFIRETAIFLVILYFTTWAFPYFWQEIRKDQIQKWEVGLGYFGIWGIIFFGLRLLLGEAVRTITVIEILRISTQTSNLIKALWYGLLFLGIFWWFIFLGYKYSPIFIKKTAWLLPVYILLITFYNIWFEVRLLMTLYPILIPLGLSYLTSLKEGMSKTSN